MLGRNVTYRVGLAPCGSSLTVISCHRVNFHNPFLFCVARASSSASPDRLQGYFSTGRAVKGTNRDTCFVSCSRNRRGACIQMGIFKIVDFSIVP